MKFLLIICFLNSTYCLNCYLRTTRKLNHALLRQHNYYRKHHGSDLLTVDDDLIEDSLEWSKLLVMENRFELSNQSDYGENIWMTKGKKDFNYFSDTITLNWYRQSESYDFNAGKYSEETASFTQMVWKATQRIGCGMCTKDQYTVLTCRYRPPGNVYGEYAGNVIEKDKSDPNQPNNVDQFTALLLVGFTSGIIIFLGLVFFLMKALLSDDRNSDDQQ